MIVERASLTQAGSGAAPDARSIALPWSTYAAGLERRVVILLSTYNGAAYLQEQLQSLLAQTHSRWILYWRDDGSVDGTVGLMLRFAAEVGKERCVVVREPHGRLWPTASFITLLRSALPDVGPDDCIAFADQDDVWLPDKLARGVKALQCTDAAVPCLYCARLLAGIQFFNFP